MVFISQSVTYLDLCSVYVLLPLLDSVSSLLQITNHFSHYASHYLWNQLPSSFCQPHTVHFSPDLAHLAHVTSSQSPPSLSLLAFYFRLKHRLTLLIVFFVPFGLTYRSWTWTGLSGPWCSFVCFLSLLLYIVLEVHTHTIKQV